MPQQKPNTNDHHIAIYPTSQATNLASLQERNFNAATVYGAIRLRPDR